MSNDAIILVKAEERPDSSDTLSVSSEPVDDLVVPTQDVHTMGENIR